MSTQTFVNLPVKDLARTKEFFGSLGFAFDQESPQNVRMVVSDDAYVLMHEEAEFRQYIGREIADTARSGEVIVGLSADSREQVDVLTAKVDEAGGRTLGPAQDQGFMYMRGFRDPDGHQWSFIYVDAAAMARPAG